MLGYDAPRLHAMLNDLPAALLVVAVLFELVSVITRREALRIAGYWTLLAGVVGAGAAIASGLFAEDEIAHGEAVHQIMETHETLAWFTLGAFAVVALWRLFRESKMASGERRAALALALAGAGVLAATGYYGGKLVFEHAAGISTAVLQDEMHERAEGHHHDGAEGDTDHDHPDSAAAVADTTPASGHTHAPGTLPHTD
jgi:uncharacterized membrane protein